MVLKVYGSKTVLLSRKWKKKKKLKDTFQSATGARCAR